MADSARPNGGSFQVSTSPAIARELARLQRKATRQGRGEEALTAFKEIVRRLQHDPTSLGEPLNQLAAMKLKVRSCAIRPYVVYFAVHEERPLVYIKAVRLLAQ